MKDAPRCIAAGEYAVFALVPGSVLMDTDDDGPVLALFECCRQHLRPVRQYLRPRMLPEDDIITIRSDLLHAQWDQIIGRMDVPVYALQHSA